MCIAGGHGCGRGKSRKRIQLVRSWQRPGQGTHPPYMIRKLKSGEYRLYSRKKDPRTGRRKNLGTFGSMQKAKQHEKAVQYFKRAG